MQPFDDALQLDRLPLSGLKLIRHLEEFDGPLLSHYVHPERKEHYLKYWCDCDATFNRWMWMRVSEASILRATNQFVPLAYVIPRDCRDGFVYFVDEDPSGFAVDVQLVEVHRIPESYTPQPDAYLPKVANRDETSYALVIGGDWSLPDLAEFPRAFNTAYALLYGLNRLHLRRAPSFPWRRDGFSSMHFFNWMSDQIPTEHKPGFHSMQYASPGFIRFAVNVQTAEQVVDCVNRLKYDNSQIARVYSQLETFIRDNGLNDEKQDSPVWQRVDMELAKYAAQLIDSLGHVDGTAFVEMCERPFEAAKVAMSFYRRIRSLVKYEKDDLVRFPNREPERDRVQLTMEMRVGE